MTCKDCLHKELCYKKCEESYDYDDCTCHYCDNITCPETCECEYFKDRNRFIELPCKFGDTVYSENPYGNADFVPKDKLIEEWKVKHIGVTIECYGCEKIVAFSDFGKTVFLTKEDAKKALDNYESEADKC